MAVHLTRGLLDRGHAVDVVLGSATGPYLETVPERANVVDLGGRRVLAALPGLTRYLKREQPDALLSFMFHANAVAVWASRLARAPGRVVISERVHLTRALRDYPAPKRLAAAVAVRRAYPHADAVVAVASGVADDLHRHFDSSATPVVVLPNPTVTPELLAAADRPPGHPWLRGDGPPVVVASGRLHPQKDFPTLVRAFAVVRRERPARLVILGEGPERSGLEALARDLGVATDVALPGFVADAPAWVARAAVFALSSAYEGLPNALIEALALGVPLVATDCESGPSEILAGGEHGRLVPVGDANAMALAVSDALAGGVPPPEPEAATPYTLAEAVARYEAVLLGGPPG